MNLAFIGMGGSGIVGDIMKVVLEEKGNEVSVIKDYRIPNYLNKDFLVFVISYSGNTFETLRCFKQCIRKKIKKIVVVTSDGRLNEIAEKKNVKIIKVKKGLLPREALFDMLFPILDYFKIKYKKSKYEFSKFNYLIDKINQSTRVYAIGKFYPVALRMLNQFNENCKISFKISFFPELMHNEIESYLNLKEKINIIIFREGKEKIIDAFKNVVRDKANFYEIRPKGKTIIDNLIYLISLVDYLSYKFAEKNKIYFKKTPLIDAYKKYL